MVHTLWPRSDKRREEVRREARDKRADLGRGKPKKNGLYKEISLRYRFFLEKGS